MRAATLAIAWCVVASAILAATVPRLDFVLLLLSPTLAIAAAAAVAVVAAAGVPILVVGARRWTGPARLVWLAGTGSLTALVASALAFAWGQSARIALAERHLRPRASVTVARWRVDAYVTASPVGPAASELFLCAGAAGPEPTPLSRHCLSLGEIEHAPAPDADVRLSPRGEEVWVEYRAGGRARTQRFSAAELARRGER